jgi:hypothetical protein
MTNLTCPPFQARISSWEVFRELYTTPDDTLDFGFSGKKLGDEGTMIVSDALGVFTSLQSLNLSDNGIGKR